MTVERVILSEWDNECETGRNMTDPRLGMHEASTQDSFPHLKEQGCSPLGEGMICIISSGFLVCDSEETASLH